MMKLINQCNIALLELDKIDNHSLYLDKLIFICDIRIRIADLRIKSSDQLLKNINKLNQMIDDYLIFLNNYENLTINEKENLELMNFNIKKYQKRYYKFKDYYYKVTKEFDKIEELYKIKSIKG